VVVVDQVVLQLQIEQRHRLDQVQVVVVAAEEHLLQDLLVDLLLLARESLLLLAVVVVVDVVEEMVVLWKAKEDLNFMPFQSFPLLLLFLVLQKIILAAVLPAQLLPVLLLLTTTVMAAAEEDPHLLDPLVVHHLEAVALHLHAPAAGLLHDLQGAPHQGPRALHLQPDPAARLLLAPLIEAVKPKKLDSF